jgi:glutamate carboxypeptidase
MNFAGVRAVGREFEPRFADMGFETRWVDGSAWGRAGHLIATHLAPEPGPHALLIGHLDTVFEADSPFQRYEPVGETLARGPGTTDMKGGNVVMLLALAALREAGALERLSVTAILIGDEEKLGSPVRLARADLVQAAERADFAIGFEDGDGNPRTAVIARRGSTRWELVATGRPAHSSQIFREEIGSGAIFKTAIVLAEFHEALAGEANLTFNPGMIVGGTEVTTDPEQSRGTAFGKSNVIAESAHVTGDLRALTAGQLQRAKARMREIVSRELEQTSAKIVFHDVYPPLAPNAGNRELLAKFDRSSRDLGFGPVTAVDPARAGAADISFTAGLVEMALDGVGLMGEGGHTENEIADLSTLPTQAKRVAVTLWRLSNE